MKQEGDQMSEISWKLREEEFQEKDRITFKNHLLYTRILINTPTLRHFMDSVSYSYRVSFLNRKIEYD